MNTTDWWSKYSFGSRYPKNDVRVWCDTDNEANCQRSRYSESSVSYQFNEHGFRSGPLIRNCDKKQILVSGCSHTVGIGIAVENTWPRVLERLIGDCVVHNLAIGGASGDYVVRSIYLADHVVSADMFFVLWPDRSRFEIYQQHSVLNLQISSSDYPKILVDETHHHNNYQKNLAMLNLIAKDRPVFYGTTNLARSHESAPRARDGIHNCEDWHKHIAQAFYIKYQENDRADRFSVAQDIIDYKKTHDQD